MLLVCHWLIWPEHTKTCWWALPGWHVVAIVPATAVPPGASGTAVLQRPNPARLQDAGECTVTVCVKSVPESNSLGCQFFFKLNLSCLSLSPLLLVLMEPGGNSGFPSRFAVSLLPSLNTLILSAAFAWRLCPHPFPELQSMKLALQKTRLRFCPLISLLQ